MSQAYLDDMSAIWDMVRNSFHATLSSETVNLWFADVTVVSFENDTITLSTPSDLKWHVICTHHLENIQKGFCNLLGFNVKVNVINGAKAQHTPASSTPAEPQPEREVTPAAPTPLFPSSAFSQQEDAQRDLSLPTQDKQEDNTAEYTFDNFVIGASNKFAHAACYAVAESPAKNYNPLFIHGASGLGKTHLMYAVINELKRKNPAINIIYIQGDAFTNELVNSIRCNEQHKFREKYRKCDVLLIDDIQFIAGKESTQEEFFHTFNALHQEKKQIILPSDRPPREIKTLENRLKTRFEWGLIADIQPPDFELRIAIIKKKAEQIHLNIPDDVMEFLAENLRTSIRSIEGSIKTLSALSMLTGKELNMELANSCIAELVGEGEPLQVTIDKIFDVVQEKFNVNRADIEGTRRTKDIAIARHVAIYLIRVLTDMSLPSIGKMFNRDHSTIMNSIDAVEKRMRSDSLFVMDVTEMKKAISGQR